MSAERRANGSSGVGRILRWLGIILGALVILIIVSAVVLPRIYPSEQIKALIVPRVESALERDFEVETAGVRILPWPSLRLRNFEVANAEGFGSEPAIEGEALDLNLKLLPLFRGEVEVDNIELIRSFVRYEVNEEGESNFEGLGGAEEDAEAAPLAVTVSNFSARNANVSYINQQTNRQAHLVLDFQADAVPNPEAGTIQSQGSVSVESIKTFAIDAPEESLTFEDLRLAYDVTANMEEERAAINRLAFTSGSFLLEASGILEDFATEPTIDLQIANEGTDLSGLADLMSTESADEVPLQGAASFNLQVSGPVGTPAELALDGVVELSDVAYAFETFNEPLRVPAAEFDFGGQDLAVEETFMHLGDNELAVNLQVSDLFAAFAAEEADAGLPAVQFELTSDRLDLTNLYAEADPDEPTYFELLQARLANEEAAGQDPGAVAAEFYGDMSLPPAEMTGEVEIGEFISPPYRVSNLSFQTVSNPVQIAVENVSGRMYEGTIQGEMTVQLTAEEPPYPASYQFSLEDGSAGAFLEDWTTLGPVVTGNLNYTLDGSTSFDATLLPVTKATNADGEAVVTDGGFQNLEIIEAVIRQLGINADALISFERLGGPYEIREARLLADGWALETNNLEGEVDGTFGFGGDVDLELGLAMPVSMLQNSRLIEMIGGDISSLLNRLAGEDEMVDVQVGIGGTMNNPQVKVNTDALQQVLRDLIREAGERIPDLLQRLR